MKGRENPIFFSSKIYQKMAQGNPFWENMCAMCLLLSEDWYIIERQFWHLDDGKRNWIPYRAKYFIELAIAKFLMARSITLKRIELQETISVCKKNQYFIEDIPNEWNIKKGK